MAEENGTSIDRLDIEIAANANTADTALKKLSTYLRGVTAALKGMTKGLNEQAKEAEQSADGTEKTAESVKQLSKNAKNATGFMGKFVKSIGRIAFYRAIRTVIKALSTAIKDGLTNLKAYSDTVGTAFSPAVDSLRQHVLMLKNAFATALRPVIEAIIPVIIQLVDWLAKAADFVAQVLSVVTGKLDDNGRYTKAVLGDLEQSNKEAKELRRTLLGFDEINRLDGDTGRGTSTAASTQFVQAEVSPEAQKWAKTLKSIDWAKIGKALQTLAVIFGILKAGSIISKFGEFAAHIAGIAGSHAGLAAAAVAIGLMATNGEKIADWFDKARQKVDNFFDGIDEDSQTGKAAIETIKYALDIVLETISTVSRAIYKLFHGDIEGFLEEVINLVSLAVQGIIVVVGGLLKIIFGIIDDIYMAVQKCVQWLWNELLQPFFNTLAIIIDNIDKAFKTIWLDLQLAAAHGIKFVLELVADALRVIEGTVNGVIDTLNALGANIKPINLNVDGAIADVNYKIDELEQRKVELQPTSWDAELVPKWKDEDLQPLNLSASVDIANALQFVQKLQKQATTALRNAYGKVFGGQSTPVSVASQVRKNLTFAQYASGGFPSAGSLFVAGEAGPELVANVGGDTGVWNSDQLVQGMYSAFSAALAANPSGGDIYLDGEVIYKNTVRRNNNAVRATGRSALLT